MKSKVIVTGTVRLVLRDALGRVKLDRTEKNAIVDSGLAFLASRAIDASAPVMSHIAIGDDATAVAPANTALGNELARSAFSTPAVTLANTITYEATFNPGAGTGAITEAGVFNDIAVGTMLNRLVFGVVNKGVGDTLDIEWTVSLADDGV